MLTRTCTVLLLALLATLPATAQKKYKVTPDSPEEKALLEIQGESNAQKRVEMLDEFSKKFAASEALPATYRLYQSAYLELQQYDKSIESGERALDAEGEELMVLMSLARAAQAKGDYPRVHKYTAIVAPILAKERASKPADLDEDDLKRRDVSLKSYHDFLEYSLFEAISRDNSPARAEYIATYEKAFAESENIKKLPAMYALLYQQQGNVPKMIESAEKAIAAEPDNETMLLLLGETHVQMRKRLADSQQLAQQLLKVMEAKKKPDSVADADWQKYINNYRGAAYSIIGRALMLQEKTAPAIAELQTAAKLLEGNNEAVAPVLYFLGFGLAKLQRYSEARPVLTRAAGIGGPYAQPSRDILTKMAKVK